MVEIEIVYEGALRTTCQHGPSASRIVTDAPVDNQGRGEAFSPTDLLAAAVGSCMLTVMGIRAQQEGWSLDGACVHVAKRMTSAPRRVGHLVLDIEMPGALDEAARAALERVAGACPVKQSLHPDVELDVRFRYTR